MAALRRVVSGDKLEMYTLFLASIILRIAGLIWSLVLVRRLRDWRMAFLSAMLFLMACRQILTLVWLDAHVHAGPLGHTGSISSEIPGFVVSVLAFLAVWLLEDIIHDRSNATARIRDYTDELYRTHELGALGTMAAGIAHEFNNTLSAVSGYTELALAEINGAAPVSRHLGEVLAASRRGERIVQQIADFAQEATSSPATTTDLTSVVSDVLRLLRVSLPGQMQMRRSFCSGSVPVAARAIDIQNLLVGLCMAGRDQWTRRGGVLEVGIDRLPHARQALTDEVVFDVARLCVRVAGSRETFSGQPAKTRNYAVLAGLRTAVRQLGGWLDMSDSETGGWRASVHLPVAESPEKPFTGRQATTRRKAPPMEPARGALIGECHGPYSSDR